MRIKDRLSPYPILDNQGDDYVESSFDVEYDVVTQFKEVKGKLIFKLNNDDIQQLIDTEIAEFTAHIECPSTCYRTIESTTGGEIEFSIDATQLAKMIEIRTFIVLKKAVESFKSNKFHPDYEGQSFSLLPHQIIAIGTAMDYIIEKDDRDLDELPSIIQIKKFADKSKGSITVNTDSDEKILIGLQDDIYDLYARLGKSAYRDTSFSLVLMPAMLVILQRMCNEKDDVDMTSRHWFQVVNSLLETNGFKLDNISVDNDTLLKVCQAIFSDPLRRSFKELDIRAERV